MKALVIGGNGFIGSHLVDKLLANGDSVLVLDYSHEKYRKPLAEVEYIIGNFNDLSLLNEGMINADIVYHLASTTVPSTSNHHPERDLKDNLIGTIIVLNQMRKTGLKRIVFMSSGGTIYGNPETIPVNEDHPLHPICSYGVVKVAVENYLHMYNHLYGLQPIALRPSNPYGSRQGHMGILGLVNTVFNKMINDLPVEIWGDGSIIRDYIYIDDLTELMMKAGHSEVIGTFNVGSGQGHSINDIIRTVSEFTGITPDVKYLDNRAFDVKEIVLDITKAKKAFDWAPTTSLHDGIAMLWEWMRKIHSHSSN